MKIKTDVDTSKLCSMKVGGIAEKMYCPETEEEFCEVFKKEEKLLIAGNFTNMILTDEKYGGAILSASLMSGLKIRGDEIEVYAGTPITAVCNAALNAELSGLEFAYGIPGSFGGAVVMNGGAYGGEISDLIISVRAVDRQGRVRTFQKSECGFSYRKSIFQSSSLAVISAVIKLSRASRDEIKAKMNENMKKRRDKQPLEYPSCGSAFKRPKGNFAGALIENCKLKGFCVGGAQISTKHAGFVINTGGATAGDVLELMKEVQTAVYESTGVLLESEIKFVGEKTL